MKVIRLVNKENNVPSSKTEEEPHRYIPADDSGDLDDFIFNGEYIKLRSEK
jgi:hypothetical protein